MRSRTAGLTLVEIMVVVPLVGICCAFVLGVHVRMSVAINDQTTVAELQQTLRAANQLIVDDLRMAGYLAASVSRANTTTVMRAVTVTNGGSSAPDSLTIIHADPASLVVIPQTGNDSDTYRSTAGTLVGTTAGFARNQVVLATHVAANGPANAPSVLGIACLLKITSLTADHIFTDPSAGTPWAQANNTQCDTLAAVWNDGYTAFAKPVFRAYRIKSGDPRGVLQMSATGGVVDDWQDLALGIVDLQIALQLYQKDDTVDEDGDGNPEYDWVSGDNMEAIPATAQITQVSVTLLAKSTREVRGALLTKTPDLSDPANLTNNSIGDVAGQTLPVHDTSSAYYGDHIYRTYTTTVDLRNSALGD